MDQVSEIREHCGKCGYLWRCKYCAVEYDKESAVRKHKCRDSDTSTSSENENNDADVKDGESKTKVPENLEKIEAASTTATAPGSVIIRFIEDSSTDQPLDTAIEKHVMHKKPQKLKGAPRGRKRKVEVKDIPDSDNTSGDVSCVFVLLFGC